MQIRILVFLLLGVAVHAQEVQQENESQGMKRILHPTLNPATDLQGKTFYGGADKGFSAKASNVRSFQWQTLFRLRPFAGAKDYQASKYWTGDFVGRDNKARTSGNYTIPKADTKVEVKTNPVREDRDARKRQETEDYAQNRPFLLPGKSQKILDSQQTVQTPMTVDDVKKLLNTTR